MNSHNTFFPVSIYPYPTKKLVPPPHDLGYCLAWLSPIFMILLS